MSSVTIGKQTYIRIDKGWVDKKTKQPAPEGLIKLLDKVAEEGSPAGKRKRVRIDTSRPVVKLGSSEYVWDLNSSVWIDKKTKDAVNPRFSAIIEAAYQQNDRGVTAEDQLYTRQAVVNGMGAVGQTRVKKPAGTGNVPSQARPEKNLVINQSVVDMITHLASIDGFLKQKLKNQQLVSAGRIASAREAAVEATDATPEVPQSNQADAEKEEDGGMGGKLAAAAIVAGVLGVAFFDPVKEAVSGFIDATRGIWDFIGRTIGVIGDGIKSMLGSDVAVPAGTVTRDSSGNLQAAEGYRISQPSASTGNRYVYREGSNVGYRIDDSGGESTPTIDYSRRANITPSTSSRSTSSTPAPDPSPVATRVPSGGGSIPAPAASATGSRTSSPSSSTTVANPPEWSRSSGNETQAETTNATAVSTSYDGLRIKNRAENTGGGPAADNTIRFAHVLQNGLGSLLTRFTAFNDRYHQGTNSPHTRGVAFDFTISDPSQSRNIANRVKQIADENNFRVSVLNEYTNPTRRSTGGHIHVTVNGPGVGSTVRGGSGDGEPGPGGALYEMASAVGNVTFEGLRRIAASAFKVIEAATGPTSLRGLNESLSQDPAQFVRDAQLSRVTAIAESRTEEPSSPTVVSPPNINRNVDSAAIENIPTGSAKASVDHYLDRMGLSLSINRSTSFASAFAGSRA